jgi:hypothetical protein
MAANLQTESGASVSELVGGIIHDAQNLLAQQLALFKQEMRDDIQKARDGALSLALAAGLLLVGGGLLCLMLVALLHEQGGLLWWQSFGIVGGILALVGGVLAILGREKLRTVSAAEKTAKGLEENLEWKTKPT